MTHRPTTLDLGNNNWAPTCSCGWVDLHNYPTQNDARVAANQHAVDKIRGTRDPNQLSLEPRTGKAK